MNKILPSIILQTSIFVISCGGRSVEQQKVYTDSLMHVISCSPTIVDGPYTLEDQLNACDMLIKEYPEKKEKFEKIKSAIKKQIKERYTGLGY